MCTLVFGLNTLGPGTVMLATNRDEDPARSSERPRVLHGAPRVVGGRDARAGGTWLAVRSAHAGAPPGVALLLNRRDPAPGTSGRRSRGALTLDVAAADDPRTAAEREASTGRYAPCSLVWLSPGGSWVLAIRAGRDPEFRRIAPGWHALAHYELDDSDDPRTAWLVRSFAGFAPSSREEATAELHARLTRHTDDGSPGTCLHAPPAPTVSSARVWIAPGELHYTHAEGPPCTSAFEDVPGWTAGDRWG